MFSEMTYFNGVQEKVADMLEKLDKWGGPETYPHMAAGWAVAFDTPYKWTKQMASDYGGTKVGMAVHWPKGIKAKGELRTQFHHVIDVAPTILEAAGLPEPRVVNGVPQRPMDGVSMVYTFDDARREGPAHAPSTSRCSATAPSTTTAGSREPSTRRPGSTSRAGGWPRTSGSSTTRAAISAWSTTCRRSTRRSSRSCRPCSWRRRSGTRCCRSTIALFERINAALVGRPDLMAGRTSLTLADGMTGMTENVFLNIKNKSKTITAEVEVPEDGGNGAILVQGGRFGGWALYVKDGVPAYDYNFLGLQRFTVAADGEAQTGQGRRSGSSSPTTAAVWARAAWVRST